MTDYTDKWPSTEPGGRGPCPKCYTDPSAKINRLTKANAELREALHNSDSLLRTLTGATIDPVITTALHENAKALANTEQS